MLTDLSQRQDRCQVQLQSGGLKGLDSVEFGRVVYHVRGRHHDVESEVVGAALRLVPVILPREEPQAAPVESEQYVVSGEW